jgi:hypothetical protein
VTPVISIDLDVVAVVPRHPRLIRDRGAMALDGRASAHDFDVGDVGDLHPRLRHVLYEVGAFGGENDPAAVVLGCGDCIQNGRRVVRGVVTDRPERPRLDVEDQFPQFGLD